MAPSIPTADEINAMSAHEYKVYENRMRRMAQRQGLRLEKSGRRDPQALGWGTYRLTDYATNTLVAGDTITGYGLGLDDVERVLIESMPADRPLPTSAPELRSTDPKVIVRREERLARGEHPSPKWQRVREFNAGKRGSGGEQ